MTELSSSIHTLLTQFTTISDFTLTGINLRLEAWLDKKRSNKLILLHRSPELLEGRSLTMASSYDGWSGSGQLISIKKWLSEVSLCEIDQFVKHE